MSKPVASSKGRKRTQRKKSIIYRATVVSKALFYGKEKKNAKGKNKKSPLFGKEKNARGKNKKKVQEEKSCAADWYCPICTESTISDMRECEICHIWFHEECVGLTKDDDEFICPHCDK